MSNLELMADLSGPADNEPVARESNAIQGGERTRYLYLKNTLNPAIILYIDIHLEM